MKYALNSKSTETGLDDFSGSNRTEQPREPYI